MHADTPSQPRPALEALIALLVGGAVTWHLRGLGELPVTYNEMYGLLTTCLPLSPHETAVLSVGHTLEAILQRLASFGFDVCSFSGTAARWPALLATLAALVSAAWLARDRRPAAERLLTVVLLSSAAHPLTYGHYGRPYAWLMLAGLVTWILRDLRRFSWLRALAGTAAALSLPHAAPLWAATLIAAWRGAGARRTGLALEGLILLAATAWTTWLMTGPVAPYISSLRYTLDGLASQFDADTLTRLWTLPTGPDALRLLAGLAWPIALVIGMRRRPADARLWLAALAMHGVAWLVLRPPAWPRYLLPESMALPAFAAAALPTRPRARLAALGAATAYAAWALATVHVAGPGIFRQIEMRGDPAAVGALLRDGDVLVSDGEFLSDMLLFPLAATRAISIVLAESAPTVPWPTPPGPLALRVDQLRGRAASEVRVVSAPSEIPWPDLTADGRRVVVAGIRSLMPSACSELCPDAFERAFEPLVVIDNRIDDAALKKALCGHGRRRVVVVIDAESDRERALYAMLRPESQAALATLCAP